MTSSFLFSIAYRANLMEELQLHHVRLHLKQTPAMPFPRPTYLRLLTGIQNTTALAFSTFLVVHLASPLVAAVAGGEGATNVMVRLPLPSPLSLTVFVVVRQGILPPTRTSPNLRLDIPPPPRIPPPPNPPLLPPTIPPNGASSSRIHPPPVPHTPPMHTPDHPFLPRAADKRPLTRRARVRVRLPRTTYMAARQLDDVCRLGRERGMACRLWDAKGYFLATEDTTG